MNPRSSIFSTRQVVTISNFKVLSFLVCISLTIEKSNSFDCDSILIAM